MSGRTARKILVTNDDGIHSLGLKLLWDAVRPLGKTIIFAPETPKSASGLGITLHKPLRIQRVKYWGTTVYATNGTPSDIIYLALNEISPKLDLVVSGVNVGDNTSVQVILSSGTVGAAAQAALLGIPSIAFSAAVEDAEEFSDPNYYNSIMVVAREISRFVLENGLPEGIHVLNVNFPRRIHEGTRVRIARVAPIKFLQRVNVNYDPRGNKYYWLYGMMADPIPGTDVYYVHVEESITISPLQLDLNPRNTDEALSKYLESMTASIKRILDRLPEKGDIEAGEAVAGGKP
ncbi:MAG: 5'/3'-nucleotidase SurE [Desulfurococcales archaeon]|nr:5'/3'-nucleotidase SurE [Desulfurococcales archaeon]